MKSIISFLIAICFAVPVFAQPRRAPGIAHRQVRQHERIKQGVKSGELTPAEAAKLRHGQKEIREMKNEAKEDGVVTREEKKEIMQQQNRESKKIYRMKHNERSK